MRFKELRLSASSIASILQCIATLQIIIIIIFKNRVPLWSNASLTVQYIRTLLSHNAVRTCRVMLPFISMGEIIGKFGVGQLGAAL